MPIINQEPPVNIQLGMIGLDVRDIRRSIEFYRLLGLAVPEPFPDRPVSLLRMDSGVSLVLAEGFAAAADPDWARPEHGYQQFLEFFVGDDAAVDDQWNRLTAAGYHGRMAPRRTTGPYAAMVDDPDGNVVLISSDPAANVSR
ncbi:VOC family protein [Actinoplanes sp. NPDC051343]|uniref:VOC family protein n=1 Tax=Actinoplanes sp. NPDC051343 TaxID=3363906 RepID=UPI0037B2C70A